MLLTICKYIIYFITYSFLGWVMEVVLKLIDEHKFVNRGFLIGPVCPIYGWGVLFIVLLIDGNFSDILSVFLKSILICSILEYSTSFVMEKLFKARWWDYSNKRFNINGRICLETMIPFGVMGSLIVIFVHPFIVKVVSLLSNKLIIILGIILFVLYLVDNLISFNVMTRIKLEIKKYNVDSTEVIKGKMKKWLNNNSVLFKRIYNAFPKFSIIGRRGKK